MIDIVKNIFQDAGFKGIESNLFTLFSYTDKTSYWIVLETDMLDFLNKQDELFIEAKKLTENNPAFDKNASLLLLYKIPDDAELNEFKKHIIEIEEDPYQFKKQVLVYKETAKKELDKQLNDSEFTDLLSNQDTFKEYKDNYTDSSWQALLYRVAQKLPFVEIKIQQNKNLTSLFHSNNNAINIKMLDDINNQVTEAFMNLSANDIKAMDSNAVFDLLVTEEEKEDGTKN